MTTFHSFSKLAFFAVLLPLICSGQKEDSIYSVIHPVPKEMMRDMETDRPDVTESSYTVDAGHFQYETDLIKLIKEKSDLHKTNTLLINQSNLKIGITGSIDLQVVSQNYGRQEELSLNSDSIEKSSGIGDITFRLKKNIVGNNEGNFAMAIIPYIKFPTSKYDEQSCFEGGFIIPMSYQLPDDWKLGFQVEVDRLKDSDYPAMHTEFLQTLTVSHPIIKGIDGIAETYYTYDFKAHELSNFINAAIQMEIFKGFKLDAGINYGIQDTAAKYYFIGASYRH